MQLHQFTGVVLINMPGRVVRVVEVLKHRRMSQRCQYQLAEMAENVWANGVFGIVADQPTHISFVLEDIEVVKPELNQLLSQLRARIDRAQYFPALRFVGQLVALFLQRLVGLYFFSPVGQLVDACSLDPDRSEPLQRFDVRDFQAFDLTGNCNR